MVNLDKPPGPTSHQVAAWVRELTGIEKAAHAGTLDPKVTGCLPVLLGDATRIAGALIGQKQYVAVLAVHQSIPDDAADVIGEFEGQIYQKPPRKSAVSRSLRTREIIDLEILEAQERELLLRVTCESGTYIRKLCHDIGLALGTGAHMGDLRRTQSEPFSDTDLVTLHDVQDAVAFWEADGDESALREVVQPAERALSHLPRVIIANSAAESVSTGAPVYAPGIISAADVEIGDHVACYTQDGSVVCLGTIVGEPGAATGEVIDLDRVLV